MMNAKEKVSAAASPTVGLSSRCASTPIITRRPDPVIYSTWNPRAPILRAQAKFYEEMGYLHLQNVFSPAEVAKLQTELNSLRNNAGQIQAEEVITERGTDDLRSIFKIHATHPLFERLATDERLVRIAQFLLGDDVYIHQSRINFKPGFGGREFYWHSDFETWHIEDGMPRMRAVSMSISLSKTSDFNGPLMLIPKSQNEFVGCVGATPDDHYKQSLKKQEYGVPDEGSLTRLVGNGGIVSAKGPAGSVTIFDCNVMHGSNSNITPHPRSNVFIVYNACANRLVAPFGGAKPRPEFLAARESTEMLRPERGLFG